MAENEVICKKKFIVNYTNPDEVTDKHQMMDDEIIEYFIFKATKCEFQS